MDDNTKWIKNKKEDEGFDDNIDEGFEDEGFEDENEGFEDTSSEAIRAIEEKINQARKHFTKLPLFESLQPRQIQEGYSTKNGLIKFDEKEKKKFNNLINQFKLYSDPETIINRVVSLATKNKNTRKIATTYFLYMFYLILVIIGTYNIYNIPPSKNPANGGNGDKYEFIKNASAFLVFIRAIITGMINISPEGHHRFLIAFLLSMLGVFFISNPLSLVILILSALAGKWTTGLRTLLKSLLIPFIIIFGIVSQIMNIPKFATKIDILTNGVMGYIMSSCLSLICMIISVPFVCVWFSISMFRILFMSAGIDNITNTNNKVNEDINGDTTKPLNFDSLYNLYPKKNIIDNLTNNPEGAIKDIVAGMTLASGSPVDAINAVANGTSGSAGNAVVNGTSGTTPINTGTESRPDTIFDSITKFICNHIIFFTLLIVHISSLINTKANILFMMIPISTIFPYVVYKNIDKIKGLWIDFFKKTDINASS